MGVVNLMLTPTLPSEIRHEAAEVYFIFALSIQMYMYMSSAKIINSYNNDLNADADHYIGTL